MPIYLKILKELQEDREAGRSSIVSTNLKTRINRSLTTGRHTLGGALPPEVFSAQAQDDPKRMVSIRTDLRPISL
jgi:hypothetical protein